MSRWLPVGGRPQYATRRRCGETAGCTASPAKSLRVFPVATSTAQSSLTVERSEGLQLDSVEKTISRPSGDHAGLSPNVVSRRALSPEAPTRKIPFPPQREEYAIVSPSGEKAGHALPSTQSGVRSVAIWPPVR